MSNDTIDVRGRKVKVFEAGSGEPLVYMHGWADIHSVTDGLQPFHKALAAGRHVLAPAHPGVNGSDDLTSTWGIEDVVFHWLEVLDALGLDRFDLVGHSFGGWIAAEVAVRIPERVKRLALIDAMGLFVEGAPTADVFMHAQPERGVDYRTLRGLLFQSPDAPLALEYFPNGRGNIDVEVRRYEMLRLGSFVGFKPPYFYNRSLRDRLYRASMPAAVVWGEKDGLVPRAHGEAFAAGLGTGGAKLALVAGAGHSAPLEQPTATAKHVNALMETKI
ncbi:MAG: hypothetical protein RLZ98_3054 [Pseudomonadota bacterium]